jgi:hypothetical protein
MPLGSPPVESVSLRQLPGRRTPIVPQPMGSTQLRRRSNRFSGQSLSPHPHRPPAYGQYTAPPPLKLIFRSVPLSPTPFVPQPMGSTQLHRCSNRFSGQSLSPPPPSSPSPWAAHSSIAAQTGSHVSPSLPRPYRPPAHGQHTAPPLLKPVLRSVPLSPTPIVPQPMSRTQLLRRSNRFSGQSLSPPSPSSPSQWAAHSSAAAKTDSQVSPSLPNPSRPPAHGQHTAPSPLKKKPVLRSVPLSPAPIVPQPMGSTQLRHRSPILRSVPLSPAPIVSQPMGSTQLRHHSNRFSGHSLSPPPPSSPSPWPAHSSTTAQTDSQVSPSIPLAPIVPQPIGSTRLHRCSNRFSGQSLSPSPPLSPSLWAAHSSVAAQTDSQVSPSLPRPHCPPAHVQHTAPPPLELILRSVPLSPAPIVLKPMGSTQLLRCSNRFTSQSLSPLPPSSACPWAAHSSVAAQTSSHVSPSLPRPHRPPAHGQHTSPSLLKPVLMSVNPSPLSLSP